MVEITQDYKDLEVLVAMDFEEKAAEYIECCEGIKALEARKKELAGDIEASLVVAEAKKVRFGDYVIQQSAGKSASKLDARKLVELGVDPDIIQQATVAGNSYTYIQAREYTAPVDESESTL